MTVIGEILKKQRKKRGYTQQQIADILRINQPTYALYESGTNVPPTLRILSLADLYDISTDLLLGRYK